MAFQLSETTRVFKALPLSKSGIELAEESIKIVGDEKHFMVLDPDGIYTCGETSWISMGPDRRLGGFWVHQIEFLDMIPETIVTPFPNILPMPPIFALAKWAKDMAFFAAMLA